jgi:hypothetical protein
MMTPQQLATLGAYIASQPDLAAFPLGPDGATDCANALNADSAPAFYAWKTSLSQMDCFADPGFAFVQVDNLSVGKARIWEWMFKDTGNIDPSRDNIRAGISACWTGNAPNNAVAAAVLALCFRNTRRCEQALAVGTGTTAEPAKMGYEGTVTYLDVEAARGG